MAQKAAWWERARRLVPALHRHTSQYTNGTELDRELTISGGVPDISNERGRYHTFQLKV